MEIEIFRNAPSADLLQEYAGVPMSFMVKSRLRVLPPGCALSALTIDEEPVEPPYTKDYDTQSDAPIDHWLSRWDISHWVVISAYRGNRRVGGAIVGYRSPEALLEEIRDDIAVLWDIRVHPDCRGAGVGSRLFRSAAGWARERGCKQLKVETQDINVAACRFYESQGCELRVVNPNAYPEFPDEIQLLWYLDL